MGRVIEFVAGLVGRAGLAADRTLRLELAIEEWVVNLCVHAYPERDGEIEVAVRKGSGELLIEIIDDGPPFDPTASEEPDVALPLDQREPGGLGLVLIRRMVDDVRYSRDGGRNIVTLAVAVRQS
ncbi:MAG: ATP-binding protein [Acidobacteriia bacterium]|nr:ATP-binding protein [Terriglobia bacterium]